ncbi:oligosaccharide flippase family protein [Priestia megaterium]|uniref:oligosaccharide flippase family protein n=1 Tax=Priestia megaterium TaxID=1404 RepID=UPI00399FF8F7
MKTNQLKFGVYLSYVSIFVTNITNLILTPFIVRNLGQSEYGLYMLIGAMIGYIAVLDFGLGNTTIRYIAKYRAEEDREGQENFLAITSIIYMIISFIIIIVGVLMFLNLDTIFSNSLTTHEIEIAEVMFGILIINLALTLPMKSFTGIITAYEKFILPRAITIARILVRAMVILILLSLGYKAIAIVLVDAILNILIMIFTLVYVFLTLKVKIRLHTFSKSLFKEILSYSSLVFVSVVVDQIYWRIGHLVLGVFSSTKVVGIFAIGMTMGQYFIAFSTAISGVFLPKITKMVVNKASGEQLTDLLIKTGRLQFLVLGLVVSGFVLFGDKFIFLWVGAGYESSWIIALIVMIPLTIVLTQTIGISILQAKNMHGFRAITYLCISVINMFISIYLAHIYGAIGVAFGTTLSLILGNIIAMNVYYHYKVGLNIPRFFKELFNGLLIAFILSLSLGLIILMISDNSWMALIIQCVIYLIIYVSVMWRLGMNNYEKELLVNEFIQAKRKLPQQG